MNVHLMTLQQSVRATLCVTAMQQPAGISGKDNYTAEELESLTDWILNGLENKKGPEKELLVKIPDDFEVHSSNHNEIVLKRKRS